MKFQKPSYILCIFLVLTFCISITISNTSMKAQPVTPRPSQSQDSWILKWHTSPYKSFASDVAIDSQGDIIVFGAYSRDMTIVKVNSAGDQLWNQSYAPDFSQHEGRGLAVDSSDNIIIAFSGFYVMKYSSTGIFQWDFTANDTAIVGEITDISIDSSGNIYVVGITGSYPQDIFLIKINSNGVEQWALEYSINTELDSTAIELDSLNNIYVAGYYDYSEMILLKFNNVGSFQWNRTWDTPLRAFGLAIDSSDNIFVTGTNNDLFLFKYDSAGTLQWSTFWNDFFEEGYDIAFDSQDNIYVTGETGSGGGTKICVLKFDSSGTLKEYGTWEEDVPEPTSYFGRGNGIAIDDADNIYVAGEGVWSGAVVSYDMILMKNLEISPPSPSGGISGYNILLFMGLISSITLAVLKKYKNIHS